MLDPEEQRELMRPPTRPKHAVEAGKPIACVICMMKNVLTTAVSALAIAGTIACGNNNRSTNASSSTPPPAPATDQKAEKAATPITVTGCLQRDGGTYIVTRLNEPSEKGVGTTGSGAAVEHEQLREAANAYRVDPKQDTDLDKMIGKKVSVNGTLEDKANLPQASGTSGQSSANDRPDIGRTDLAKISADNVSVVSDNCGGAAGAKGHAKTAAAKKRR